MRSRLTRTQREPLLVELQATRARQAAEELTVGTAYRELGYVVCNEIGEPYHPDTLSKMWTKSVRAAGVPVIRLHDARHTRETTMHSQPDALAEGAQSWARAVAIRDKTGDRDKSV